MGSKINTDQSEFAPFLMPDGRGLFFVSSGHGGEGGNDIFFTKRTGDSRTKWTEAFNLGSVINSSGEETYFSITDDFKTIYFESYSDGSRDRDIYRVGFAERFHPPYDLDRLHKEVSEDLIAAQTSGNVDKSISTIQGQNENNDEPSPSSPSNNNKRISKKRARSVAQYLTGKGIPAERIQIAGHGEQNPLATNDDEMQGRELNRRVEISLVLPFR